MKIFAFLPLLFLLVASAHAFSSSSSLAIVGVQQVGNQEVGSLANLTVEIHPGSGRVFVDTMPLTQIDTQTAARLASEVACSTLNVNCSNYDFFYIIRSDSPMIGGPSAGGAMALATVLALTNSTHYSDIAMTGTINPDGTIVTIGGVMAKSKAVADAGFKTFLVPLTQSIVYNSTGSEINLTSYASKNWGLNVVEVGSLEQAFTYFTGRKIQLQNVTGVSVVTPVYTNLMKAMSYSLFSKAKTLQSSLGALLYNKTLSPAISSYVTEAYNSSNSAFSNITSLFNNSDYYVAASLSLQQSINLEYSSLLVNYSDSSNPANFVISFLNSTNASIEDYSLNEQSSTTLDTIHDLDLVVASFDRLRDAQSITSSAYSSYYSGDLRGALFLAATAAERLNTAVTWFNTTTYLSGNQTFVFDSSKLAALASSSLNDASIAITYASTVIDSSVSSSLENQLSSVTSDFNSGLYARTIFESLSLEAEANLFMEVRGLPAQQLSNLFSSKRDNVVRLILREENSGRLPILAISYLQYADYFNSTGDLSNALRYLDYAGQYSSLSADVYSAITGNAAVQPFGGTTITQPSAPQDSAALFFMGAVAASILFMVVLTVRTILI